jgi:hypothetical protein
MKKNPAVYILAYKGNGTLYPDETGGLITEEMAGKPYAE